MKTIDGCPNISLSNLTLRQITAGLEWR